MQKQTESALRKSAFRGDVRPYLIRRKTNSFRPGKSSGSCHPEAQPVWANIRMRLLFSGLFRERRERFVLIACRRRLRFSRHCRPEERTGGLLQAILLPMNSTGLFFRRKRKGVHLFRNIRPHRSIFGCSRRRRKQMSSCFRRPAFLRQDPFTAPLPGIHPNGNIFLTPHPFIDDIRPSF